MIIKFLHAIGLTNLSDSDIRKYYEARNVFRQQPTVRNIGFVSSSRPDRSVIKRLIDIIVSLLLLILQAPILLVISAIIKITSPGPIFCTQERMGLNARRFSMYRFRTMYVDLEHLDEISASHEPIVFTQEGMVVSAGMEIDPRITPIGRVLRKTSLDELPQLINILRGDMSLVGPRPIPARVYEDLKLDNRRFRIRPGMTGLWQIQGKSSIPFEEWLALDRQYIDHWSLWLDVRILAKTIMVVSGIFVGSDLMYPHGGSDKYDLRGGERSGTQPRTAW